MPKTGLKTFVYSFSLSLLTIFMANGAYWHTTPSVRQETKISGKNIMLFLRDEQANPSKAAPVRKIALTVQPKTKSPDTFKTEKKPAVVYKPDDEIIMADSSEDIKIPLEINPLLSNGQFKDLPQAKKTPPAKNQLEIPLERTGDTPKPAVPVIKTASANQIKEEIPLEKKIPSDKITAKTKKPQKSERFLSGSIPPAEKPQKSDSPFLIAESNGPKDLFPLQKNKDIMAGRNENIKILDHVEQDQVALADANIPIKSMESNFSAASVTEHKAPPQWNKMSDKAENADDNPWVAAKSAGKPENGMIARQDYYQKDNDAVKAALNGNTNESAGVKVASETIRNLLIPIPEDILNDENLTPQLVSSSKPDELKKEAELEKKLLKDNKENSKDRPLLIKRDEPENNAIAQSTPVVTPQQQEKKNILNSLSSIFYSDTKVKEASKDDSDGFLSGLKNKMRKNKQVKIMPTEMRLSFQPNRAEISGQTLRWIQAFATKTADDASLAIEIRMDGTSAVALQQKRLNLLHNILTNKGVEYSKINTVFTKREPNSFIIRTVKLNNVDTGSINKNRNNQQQINYLQW